MQPISRKSARASVLRQSMRLIFRTFRFCARRSRSARQECLTEQQVLPSPRSATYQPRFSHQQLLYTWLGSFLGIAILASLSFNSSYPLIAAPFGASAVLLFAVPDSPLAQPRNLVGGNCMGAMVCIALVSLFGTAPWVMALAVANAIALMQITRTLHPPGGAVALVGVMSGASWKFLFVPVLAGSIVMVLCTIAFNNSIAKKPYPKHWL